MYRYLVLLTISTFAFGQNFKKDSLAVVTVLKAQEEAWNRFDIPAFMEGYWNSPELVFCGAGGPVYGWSATKKRYEKSYDSPQKMGKLTFTILNLQSFQPDVMQLIGRFELERNPQNAQGYFTLLWKRFDSEWKIVSDHTSASK